MRQRHSSPGTVDSQYIPSPAAGLVDYTKQLVLRADVNAGSKSINFEGQL